MDRYKISRNDICPCGSGLKYKKCCLINVQPFASENEWQLVYRAHKTLAEKLSQFLIKKYGPEGFNEAWNEYHLWKEKEETYNPDSSLSLLFIPWMIYHWTPDPEESVLGNDVPMSLTPAEYFLEYETGKKNGRLNTLEVTDLEENLQRPFSFYDVLESKSGEWVKVTDMLTGEQFTVIEKMGSQSVRAGDLIFAKVISINNITLFDGIAPFTMPSQFKIRVINFREEIKDEFGVVTASLLRVLDFEVRELFWTFYDAIHNPFSSSTLINTDEQLLLNLKMIFEIDDINKVFLALYDLCADDEIRGKLQQDAKKIEQGDIESVEFPWLVRGTKQSPVRKMTVLGRIQLNKNCMIVEVHSKERAKKFLMHLKKKLPLGWKLKSTEVKDTRSELLSPAQENHYFKPIELHKSPGSLAEMNLVIKKVNEEHWKKWPFMPQPALKGLSPLDAIKTSLGREMVDALITDFEHKVEFESMPGQTLETFQTLRERLGL